MGILSDYWHFWTDPIKNVWNDFTGKTQAREANETNIDLSREQREWEAQQVAKQNEYNSPENQMARYRDAGLNPNLMYGSISSGNQSNIPTYTPAKVQPLPSSTRAAVTLGNDMLTAMLQTATIKNAMADGKIKAEQAALLREQTDNMKWKNLVDSLGYRKAKAYAPYFLSNARLEHMLLNNQYAQGIKQIDIMSESIKTSELNRILSQGRYDLEHKKFDWQTKMEMRNYLKSVKEFKDRLEFDKNTLEWSKSKRYIDIGENFATGLLNVGLSFIPGSKTFKGLKWLKKIF